MLFAFRPSLLSLALSLCLIGLLLTPVRSASGALNAAQTPAEAEVRAVVERYFVFYAAKDLDGLLALWSERSPEHSALKTDLQKQFAAEDYRLDRSEISRVKVGETKASLRATVNLTITNLKGDERREQQMARNFDLVREDGRWRIWRSAPAVNDLAEALAKLKIEGERSTLLIEEKELLTPDLVRALNDQGSRLRRQNNHPQALVLLRLAQSIGERIGDRRGVGIALHLIGLTHSEQGDYTQALENYQKSLAMSEEIGDKTIIASMLNNLGGAYFSQGNYAQALEYWQKCLGAFEALGDKFRTAVVRNNTALVQVEQGDNAQALETFQKGLAMFEGLGAKAQIADTLRDMGLVYHSLGNYRRALEHYQKSLAIGEEIGEKRIIAAALNNIGRVHRGQGNYPQALEFYQRSLAISEAIGAKYGIALVLNNLGSVHSSQGNYAGALEHYQKSLKLREEIGDKVGVASTLNNIGRAHLSQGDYAQALAYLQKSLALREEIGNKGGIVDTLNNIGDVYEKQGRYAQVLETASRAAALARQMGDTELLWKARLLAGSAARALKDTAQARPAFEEAITIMEGLRANVAGGEREQQRFFESKVSPYHAMVGLLNSESRAAEALTFAERAKARVLLDVLQTGRVNVTKAMTAEEREQERQLNLRLVSLNTQILREANRRQPDQARLSDLKAQLEKARLEFSAFQTVIYSAHPELKTQRGEAQALRIDEAAALLPDSASALVEYVVTDEVTYLFVISRPEGKAGAEVEVFSLPVKREELARQITSFREHLAGRNLGFRASARGLYDLLIKPAGARLRGKTNLVIVPDDLLWELPFQALMAEGDRYLIERSTIAYAPSLTVLREMKAQRNRRAGEATSVLLALGNPAIGGETIERATLVLRDERLEALPEAEEEVKALGRLYGPARSRIYTRAEAREDRFKTEAGRAGILHFATHGLLNNAAPMYSRLVLAAGDKNEDGLLEAWELMQLDLKAELGVLSACDTARGRFGAGEGIIGLTWAMFVAGVPSVVVSQWKVESASTRDLMLGFHRHLTMPRAKATKAEALRQAALRLMKNPQTSHPFYWAGFVLVGDSQ